MVWKRLEAMSETCDVASMPMFQARKTYNGQGSVDTHNGYPSS